MVQFFIEGLNRMWESYLGAKHLRIFQMHFIIILLYNIFKKTLLVVLVKGTLLSLIILIKQWTLKVLEMSSNFDSFTETNELLMYFLL